MSLFDGISCGRLALEKTGCAVSSYNAFEIDKYAKAISRYNYSDIQQCGDVLDADFSQFVDIDIVIGGSPCTFWSIAKANREVDKDGMGWQLFMRFVDAVRIIQPSFFLYENVASMPKNIKEYISEELGHEPILINSALVSAQQRKRLYWTNIKGVEQPMDREILLKDILERGVSGIDKFHCSEFSLSAKTPFRRRTLHPVPIDACYYKGGNHTSPNKQSGKRNMIYEPGCMVEQQAKLATRPIALADKSQTILSTIHKENALSMLKRNKAGLFVAHKTGIAIGNDGIDNFGAALRTRADENGKFKRLEIREDSKLNALTTVLTDSVVCSPVRVGQYGNGGQGDRICSVYGKTVCISANGGNLCILSMFMFLIL